MTDDELIEWLLDWGRIGEEPVLIEAASRIKTLGAALDDAVQYVPRADWHYLKDETRKALEENDG
jgi:hypothetical protein